MRSPSTTTVPGRAGAPVPSTIVPPVMTRSTLSVMGGTIPGAAAARFGFVLGLARFRARPRSGPPRSSGPRAARPLCIPRSGGPPPRRFASHDANAEQADGASQYWFVLSPDATRGDRRFSERLPVVVVRTRCKNPAGVTWSNARHDQRGSRVDQARISARRWAPFLLI